MFHKGSMSLGVAKVAFWTAAALGTVAALSSVSASANIANTVVTVVETGAGIEAGAISRVGDDAPSAYSQAKNQPRIKIGQEGRQLRGKPESRNIPKSNT